MLKKVFITSFVTLCILTTSASPQNENKELKNTITDNDIVVPPQVDRNFDTLLTDWKKNIKASPQCNIVGTEDVVYPDSVYINRLYSFPSEMELVYNPIVRSYIDMYSGRRRSQVAYMLAKSQYYFPIFEHALDKYGLPLELRYLPIIESALNPIAVSPVGATGLWQFMLGTGRQYDLEVNSLVDERRDPIKASDAAARFLKDLYGIYGNWQLVIAAYNCGPGNVNKAIRRSGGQTDYWAIYPHLPRETRGYVPLFIAATYIMNYNKEHNICPLEYNFPISMDSISINKQVHFQQISDILNIPMEDIKTLNPEYKKDIVPGNYKQYTLNLPSSKITDFITFADTIYAHKYDEFFSHRKTVEMASDTQRSGQISTRKMIHKVSKGETLAKIAKKYGVTSSQIKQWNKLRSSQLKSGQRLTINKTYYTKTPAPKPKVTEESLAENKPKENNSVEAVSNNNESEDTGTSNVLSDYFKKQKTGNINKNSNQADDESDEDSIQQPRKQYSEATKTIYHKVRIGETLTQICNRYEVSNDEVLKWNKMKTNALKVGQRLVIFIPEKTENKIITNQVNSASNPKDIKTDSQPKTTVKGKNTITVTKPVATKSEPTTKKTAKQSTTKEKVIPKTQATSSKSVKNTTTKKTTKDSSVAPSNYVVKQGDNLHQIAKRYPGVSADEIMKANKLSGDKINKGQKLVIPQTKKTKRK